MKRISRKTAAARGLIRYFTGKLCRQGHFAERQVYDGRCVLCKRFSVSAEVYRRYDQSPNGQDRRWRFEHSPLRIYQRARWHSSPKGQEALWRRRHPA